MSLIKAFGISALIYLACIVGVDIAGAILVTILPGPGGTRLNGSPGFGSTALFYIVWLVAGCFAGTFYTTGSMEATQKCRQVQQYPIIIPGFALVLSVFIIIILYAIGEMNVYSYASSDFYYVPGHRYMTYTFFISLLVVSFFFSYKGDKATSP